MQLSRLISAKEMAFQGMLKAYLLTQAFASQIIRRALDLTFTVDLTFKAQSQVPFLPTWNEESAQAPSAWEGLAGHVPWCLSSGTHPRLRITEASAELIHVQRQPGRGIWLEAQFIRLDLFFFPLFVAIKSFLWLDLFAELCVSLKQL